TVSPTRWFGSEDAARRRAVSAVTLSLDVLHELHGRIPQPITQVGGITPGHVQLETVAVPANHVRRDFRQAGPGAIPRREALGMQIQTAPFCQDLARDTAAQ